VTGVLFLFCVINRKYLFKRLGWPLKGPLGFVLVLRRTVLVFLLWPLVPTDGTSPSRSWTGLQVIHTKTACRPLKTLQTHKCRMHPSLQAERTPEPDVLCFNGPRRNTHRMVLRRPYYSRSHSSGCRCSRQYSRLTRRLSGRCRLSGRRRLSGRCRLSGR
jgi:hypothetical protein